MSDFLTNLPSDPEPLAIERDLTIRAVQHQMGDNLKRWYPDEIGRHRMTEFCESKVDEEYKEWKVCHGRDLPQETADIVIALAGYCSQAGIDLQAEIERKLAIVSARKDQPERDNARGIG